MKTLLLSLFLLPGLLPAQTPAPAPAPAAPAAPAVPAAAAPNPALAKQLRAAQKEIDTLTADLQKTDQRIEAKITKAVETLRTLTDSNDSGTRVADVKADVIDFLRKQLTDYAQRRAQVRGQLDNRQRTIPQATLESDLAKIDQRIDHRIEQVMALGGSFARHQDYDKYEATGTAWYGHTEFRLSEDWKANRRATLKAAQQTGKLGDAIDDSIRRLSSTNRYKQSQLAAARPDTARLLQADIRRNQALIGALENSRENLLTPQPSSQTPLGALEAKAIHQRYQKAAVDVRRDQLKLTGLYNNLNAARARQATLLKAVAPAPAAAPAPKP